ncbi:G-protein coupled receptor GRL101-like [Acanthaster planci]|uniref:G-protein coupled receptor GRL101-like n=1 Tax=Acanthaster planci TaxID=133434 RepID=A0A8B7YRZ6_ACAPL|nr:G-protein coupled receptor GRL101-like [Acanthaster planci]
MDLVPHSTLPMWWRVLWGSVFILLLTDSLDCREHFLCQDVCLDSHIICYVNNDCEYNTEQTCDGYGDRDIILNSTLPSVTVTSAHYPNMYPGNSHCLWFITANSRSKIAFQFSMFNLEQRYDTVTIGNGHNPSIQNSEIGSFSGSLPNITVFSKEHTAWMRFTTDSSINYSGFLVWISQETDEVSCQQDEFECQDKSSGLICLAVETACDGFTLCPDGSDEGSCGNCGAEVIYIYEDPITLTSPNYPDDYPNDVNCVWRLIGELAVPVTMRIQDFVLENFYDVLKVRFQETEQVAQPTEVFSLTGGSVSKQTFTWDSTAGNVLLELKTDRTIARRGFSITIAHYHNYTEDEDLEALCEEDEFHCGGGLCVTLSSECNGYLDCINYEDETNCNDVFCPDSYKCDNFNLSVTANPTQTHPPHSTTDSSDYSSHPFSSDFSSSDDGYLPQAQCIPLVMVCDGMMNCPNSDDEVQCDLKRCPAGCICSYKGTDLVVNCNNGWNSTTLTDLALTTHTLQLSGVNIGRLEQGLFKTSSYLKVLSLRNNLISEIQEDTFDGLDNLLWLDLSNTSLNELPGFSLSHLSSLRGITIFDVPLKRIKTEAFYGLSLVETLIIVRNIKGLPPLEIEEDAFIGLERVSKLYVDDHRLCCFIPSATECTTLEPEPPLFMCSELMPNTVLKVFMWILGISALIGNIFVMVWRCQEKTGGKTSRRVHSFLVFNLAVSDALMGLYMLIIASADAYFGERYFEVSMEWRTSILCQVAGFISIVASEASVFFLTFISIDRFLSILFPFSSYRFRPKSARIVAMCVWIGTVIIAIVPTILASDATSDVYGLSDVCIGLPLMTKVTHYETVDQQIDAGGVANITVSIPYPADYQASWFFSIALFLGVNLLCFSIILICYVSIFIRAKSSVKHLRRHKKQNDEVRMAIKMAAIVSTDFVCWVPVIIMGILSQARVVEIPTEAYAWTVVFILPINSSLNPYLYTISDLCCQQRKETSAKNTDVPVKTLSSENRISVLSPDDSLAH